VSNTAADPVRAEPSWEQWAARYIWN